MVVRSVNTQLHKKLRSILICSRIKRDEKTGELDSPQIPQQFHRKNEENANEVFMKKYKSIVY